MQCVNKQGEDQPAYAHSLISAFVNHFLGSCCIQNSQTLAVKSVAVQASLNPTWGLTPNSGFLMAWLILLLLCKPVHNKNYKLTMRMVKALGPKLPTKHTVTTDQTCVLKHC